MEYKNKSNLSVISTYKEKMSAEDLENFDHPFTREVIHSLEGLQEELTGLYSKRQFKVMHHLQLTQRTYGETYSIVVFTLSDLDVVMTSSGYEAAQATIRNMGAYIDKHFGAMGGFSTRRRTNEFVTVLPYSDLSEAENILRDFAKDVQERGIRDVCTEAGSKTAARGLEFTILAGIAQGQPIAEIESVMDSAKAAQKEIARFRCSARR